MPAYLIADEGDLLRDEVSDEAGRGCCFRRDRRASNSLV